jgi:hypothetical protein
LTVYADGSVGITYSTNETGTAAPGTIPNATSQASFSTSNGQTTVTVNGSGTVPPSQLDQAPYNYSSSISLSGSYSGGISEGSAVIHAVPGISSPFASILLNYRGTDETLSVTGNTTLQYGTYASGTSQTVLNASSISSYLAMAQKEGLNSTYLNERLEQISYGNLSVTSLSINATYGSSSAVIFGDLQMNGNLTLLPFFLVEGYVYGLFGSFTSTAEVSSSVVTCSPLVPAYCIVDLVNTGSASTSVTGCSLTVGGNSVAGTVSPTNPVVPAGGSVEVTCTLPSGESGGPSGSIVTGMIELSNGASVPFAGTWDQPGTPSLRSDLSVYYAIVSSFKDYSYQMAYSNGLMGFQATLQGQQNFNFDKALQILGQASSNTTSAKQFSILNSTMVNFSGFTEKFSVTQQSSGEYTEMSQATGLTIRPPSVRSGSTLNMSSLFELFNGTATFPGTVTVVGGSNSAGTVRLEIPASVPPPSTSTPNSATWTSVQVSQLQGVEFNVGGSTVTTSTSSPSSSQSTSSSASSRSTGSATSSTTSSTSSNTYIYIGIAVVVIIVIIAVALVMRRGPPKTAAAPTES